MASLAQPRAQIQPGPRWLAKESQREALAGYLFILPTFLGYTAFILGPIVAAVGISFTKYDILTPASFVGLENYARLFSDPRLRTVYGNTIFFTVFAVSLNVGIGLLLAVLLNRHIPGPLKYVFRSAYFFPVLVALVYSSIIWQFLYQKDTGIINYYLGLLNIEPIAWLSNKQWVLPSIIIMDVWRNTGFAMLVFLAGLQNISTEYYEAAQLDGANRLQLFRHITLPLISPTLFFNLIIYMIGALQVFDSIMVLTKGGPGDTSRSLVIYIYENAFQFFEMGYASAVAITLFIIIVILTLIQFRLGRAWVHYA
ncbi:MAG: sugar ABC transporter permease [Chloroflexi bacterium]|nr:MAG: sugar ABC transporter permease [Chloroflexota bacterium]TME88791.1 MAG: sugar ABC transporter permease [Chloroflexota bacterium]